VTSEASLPADVALVEQQIEAINRFPDQNPHPVMRMTSDGRLVYANMASRPVLDAIGARVGERLSADVLARLQSVARATERETVEVQSGFRTFEILAVDVPELDFVNLYGTDITARIAIDKFPDQNPNPVMRLSHDGVFLYANAAAAPIVRALGVEVGRVVPAGLWSAVDERLAPGSGDTMEVEAEGRLYSILVRSVREFGFINFYGTDITAARAVERANAENEQLLLNILPAPIAARLRAGERVIADRFDDVTLMFADIVDFTVLSGRLSPVDVVNVLNEVFSLFDELVDRYGLEKIKTIGDAYMVVGGLPESRPDDCERVAGMALDLTAEVAALPTCTAYGIRFRTGINSGPAVAGVIGARKFIYDVWGDTVNTASRMESHGMPGRIQVTEPVYRRLADRFAFEERGIVDVRGKGLMPTWFLVGRR
jgi:class 3 adenylate cyclase